MTAAPAIQSKLLELCQAIAADAELQTARQNAEVFLADAGAMSLYREMATLGRELHQKQHHGEEPTADEITRFNALQDRCEGNPIIRSFLGAQDVLSGVGEVVNSYVGKSLQSGRVPTAEEMAPKSGGCGEGCGCH